MSPRKEHEKNNTSAEIHQVLEGVSPTAKKKKTTTIIHCDCMSSFEDIFQTQDTTQVKLEQLSPVGKKKKKKKKFVKEKKKKSTDAVQHLPSVEDTFQAQNMDCVKLELLTPTEKKKKRKKKKEVTKEDTFQAQNLDCAQLELLSPAEKKRKRKKKKEVTKEPLSAREKKKKKRTLYSEDHQMPVVGSSLKVPDIVCVKQEQVSPREKKKKKRKLESVCSPEVMDQTKQLTTENDSSLYQGREDEEQHHLSESEQHPFVYEEHLASHKKRKKIEGRINSSNQSESNIEIDFVRTSLMEKVFDVTKTSKKYKKKSVGENENNPNEKKTKKKEKERKDREKEKKENKSFEITTTANLQQEHFRSREKRKRELEVSDDERQILGAQESIAHHNNLDKEQTNSETDGEIIPSSLTGLTQSTKLSPMKQRRRVDRYNLSVHKTSSNSTDTAHSASRTASLTQNAVEEKQDELQRTSAPTLIGMAASATRVSGKKNLMIYKCAESVDDSSSDDSENASLSNSKTVESVVSPRNIEITPQNSGRISRLNTKDTPQNSGRISRLNTKDTPQKSGRISHRNTEVTPQNAGTVVPNARLEHTDTSLSQGFAEEFKAMPCYVCEETMTSMRDYIRHLAIEHNHRSYQCQWCHRSLGSKGLLEQHYQVSCKKKNIPTCELRFRCPLCPMVYSNKKGFKKHYRDEHDSSKKTEYKCKHCGCNYSNKANLKVHELKCEKGLIRSRSSSHLQRTVECMECGKMFSSISSRSHHARSAHRNHVFDCVCGEKFLVSHVYYNHKKTCEVVNL